MLESMQSLFHSFIIDTMSEYRVATFSLSQSRTEVWGWSPSRRGPGYHPLKTFRILYVIWCILKSCNLVTVICRPPDLVHL